MESGATSQGDQSPLTTTYRGASKALQCCERKIWQLVKDRELRAIRIGRSVRIPISELEAFIARQVAANEQGGAMNDAQRNLVREFIRAVARSPQDSSLLEDISPESLSCAEHTLICRALQHSFETRGEFDLDTIRSWFQEYAADDAAALEEMLVEMLIDES